MRDPHQQFYDQLAAEWDLDYTAEDLERLSRLVDSMKVKSGENVLDLGCGTGILFDMFRRKVGNKGSVTGVDFSVQMARQAHRNFPFDNVNVVDADVAVLPFRDHRFDLVVAFRAFPHFVDKRKALAEIHRVLKPGAPFYIIHLVSSKELAMHHKRRGGVEAEDVLPSADDMQLMFSDARFAKLTIDDHPGLYLATAINS
ncbi:MAG: methyltransferase domain-containing protein [candidate division Zixibacteria bacterium]|nr:methyltransferase domain-containing protein [candidate division Zixibacteria bacterium]